MPDDVNGQPQGQPQGQAPSSNAPVGNPSIQNADIPSAQNQGNDLQFRYSDATPMTEFFRDYPTYAENPNFNKYKTVKAFAEGHEALLSKLNSSISIPDENATEEQMKSFYDRLGRPEAPDKYEFEDKLPDGLKIDEQLDSQYRDLAYSIGLTGKQAQQLRAFYNTAVETAYTANNKVVQEQINDIYNKNVTEIKEMWGGDYKAKTNIAMNTAKNVLSQETLDYLDATGLGNNAKFVKDFYELSKRLSGDSRFIDGNKYTPQPQDMSSMTSEAMKILRTPGWDADPNLKRRYEELTQQRADILYKE